MRILSTLTLAAILTVPLTALATPKKEPTPSAQHSAKARPMRHHLTKTTKPADKPAPATPSLLPHLPLGKPATPAK